MRRKLRDGAAVEHHVYRGYMIRWSMFTIDKPDNKVWVEKHDEGKMGIGHTAFICWANSVDDAKQKIDEIA